MFERYKSSLGYFWQWDSNQQLIVDDDTVFEVHFSNRSDTVALVCEIKEVDGIRVVDVPNILLQRDWPLHVYAFAQDYTKYEKTFEVKGRDKPADYVYTETEVKSFDELEKKVDEHIADNSNPHNVTAEQINTYTKEEIDEKTKVTDVQINNTSIVSNGVATIPLATNEQAGVIKPSPEYGLSVYGSTVKDVGINPILNTGIDNRQNYRSITGAQLDYAVKAAMCDGKGAAWTAEEQAAARRRLNIESGGSSGGGESLFITFPTPTKEEQVALKEYLTYYFEHNKLKPVDIYFISYETYYQLITEVDVITFTDTIHLTLSSLSQYTPDSKQTIYVFDKNTYDFKDYYYQAPKSNAKDWHWVDKSTKYSLNISRNVSHIRIVGYNNSDTNNTITYDISTSYGNNFYEEPYTKYYVVGFNTSGSVIPIYWYNTDGYNLELRDMQDNNLMNSDTFTLLGYYYWGV